MYGLCLGGVTNITALQANLHGQEIVPRATVIFLIRPPCNLTSGKLGAELGNGIEMVFEVRRQNQANYVLSDLCPISSIEVFEEVHLVIPQQLVGGGDMEVLEHRVIVVRQRQRVLGLDEEGVVEAWVLKVVYYCRKNQAKYLHAVQFALQVGYHEEVVRRLCDVRAMEFVVIYIGPVILLNLTDESLELELVRAENFSPRVTAVVKQVQSETS
mmetsp:Transcript_10100/g.20649  ORF Transcript_10100/g.20649 Transcript_10100/m.20649 type:complete len:214 (-) Transcript_10100:1222-1863(-)